MTPVDLPNFLPVLPEAFLAVAAMALLILGVFQGDHAAREIAWLAVAALAIDLLLVLTQSGERQVSLYGMFINDAFGMFMKSLVLIGSALGIILAMRFNEREGIARAEFPVLILLASAGMLMMISANDLISLYVGLETQSRSEEHTSELQSHVNLVCRLL